MGFNVDIWGNVADWVVAATAVLAVWFGRQQLIRVVEESGRQADVARADLMLKIDQIFEVELQASRKAIQTLRNRCEAAALSKQGDAEEAAHKILSAKIFSQRVTELYDTYKGHSKSTESLTIEKVEEVQSEAGKRYMEFMALPYWMETVGMIAEKRLLLRDDVLDLYDAAFIGVLDCFDGHIIYRRVERLDRDDRFLEYATWFRDLAKSRAGHRQRYPARRPLHQIYQIPSLFRMSASVDGI